MNSGTTGQARLSFRDETVVGQDFSGLTLDRFSVTNSRFEDCRFDRTRVTMFSIGAGMAPSTYVGCSFDGARLEMHPGGVARFERCSFRKATVNHWDTDQCDLVDCVFSGTIRKSMIYGRANDDTRRFFASAGISLPETNDIRGNDFSEARLVDVSFRHGVDLTLQKLPSGPDYFYFEDSVATLKRAFSIVESWPNELQRRGRSILGIFLSEAEDGQEQLLLSKAGWRPEELWNGLCAALQGCPWPDKVQ